MSRSTVSVADGILVHEPVLSAVQQSDVVTQAVVGRMRKQARLLRSQRERVLEERVVPPLSECSVVHPLPCSRESPDVLEECDKLLAFLADDNPATMWPMESPSVLGDTEPHSSTVFGQQGEHALLARSSCLHHRMTCKDGRIFYHAWRFVSRPSGSARCGAAGKDTWLT